MILGRKGSSHGVFVPLLCLYFVWRKKPALGEIEAKYEIVPGIMVVTGGFLLFSLARLHNYFFWECVSFMVVLSGLVICFLGKEWFKEISFPIVFLITMIPVPEHYYDTMADWLRQTTIMTSTELLALVGVPVLREDLLIHLPNVALKINIGCSGIRYLLSYFVFGIAYAYLFRTKTTQRILVVGLTVPISLMASTLRLTVIALLTYYIGPHMAHYWPHVITSWSVFFSVLVFFVALDRWLVSRKEKEQHTTAE
jgi:exosortase